MRTYVPLAVYVVAFAIGHTTIQAANDRRWVTDIKPISGAASADHPAAEINGFDQWRAVPDHGMSYSGGSGFQHFACRYIATRIGIARGQPHSPSVVDVRKIHSGHEASAISSRLPVMESAWNIHHTYCVLINRNTVHLTSPDNLIQDVITATIKHTETTLNLFSNCSVVTAHDLSSQLVEFFFELHVAAIQMINPADL